MLTFHVAAPKGRYALAGLPDKRVRALLDQEYASFNNRDRTIVLGLYAGLAVGDLTLFPPEERRRSIYMALGLKALIHADDRIEIDLSPAGDFFPPEKETREMVERIVYDPERMRAKEELRARIVKRMKRGVMSCDILD